MPLSIKDRETEQLARELAARTGESITVATRRALADRLRQLGREGQESQETARRLAEMRAISRRVAQLPERDNRSADDIVGYDERGLPR